MKKKVKKYAGGGLSGIAQEANSLMGAADNAASAINTIKSGSTGGAGSTGSSEPVGFLNENTGIENPSQNLGTQVQPFKKGGKVSSASKRADGIAIRGKTRA